MLLCVELLELAHLLKLKGAAMFQTDQFSDLERVGLRVELAASQCLEVLEGILSNACGYLEKELAFVLGTSLNSSVITAEANRRLLRATALDAMHVILDLTTVFETRCWVPIGVKAACDVAPVEWEHIDVVVSSVAKGVKSIMAKLADEPQTQKTKSSGGAKQGSTATDVATLLSNCNTASFLRNAFRGPFTNVIHHESSLDDDEAGLIGIAKSSVEAYYARVGPDCLRAHAKQLLANGTVEHFRFLDSGALHAVCNRLCLSSIASRVATNLELANFVACALIPPPQVVALLAHQRNSADLFSRKRLRSADEGARTSPAKAKHTLGLAAIGGLSRGLDDTFRLLDRDQAEGKSRKELLTLLCLRVAVPFTDVVEATTQHLQGLLCEPLPNLDVLSQPAFESLSQEDRDAALDAALKRQFMSVHEGRSDAELRRGRVLHLVAIPTFVLPTLLFHTSTKNQYEQYLIRMFRLPFSRFTRLFELQQWVWDHELEVMLLNALSYIESDARKREVLKKAGSLNSAAIELLLKAQENFLKGGSGEEARGKKIGRIKLVETLLAMMHRSLTS